MPTITLGDWYIVTSNNDIHTGTETFQYNDWQADLYRWVNLTDFWRMPIKTERTTKLGNKL